MKKIFFSFTLSVSILSLQSLIICSEKNWLQSKLDAFTHKMITRHTYEHNSFEHIRDRALLFALPPSTSQAVLMAQRSNMQKFLKQNEENTLEEVRKYWNIDPQNFAIIKNDAKKEHEFKLNAMKKPDGHDAYHNPLLPQLWTKKIEKCCEKQNINAKSLILDIEDSLVGFAGTREYLSTDLLIWKYYNPTKITLNTDRFYKSSLNKTHENRIMHIVNHELTHIMQGHSSLITHIGNSLSKKERQNFYKKEYIQSSIHQNFINAIEKTADTLLACSDSEVAKIAVDNYDHRDGGYINNANDIRVLNSNWQTSQTITNFQQLKSSITQKLAAFPKFVA